MLTQCAAVTLTLVAVSLAARFIVESSESTLEGHARQLLDRALHWRDVADGERRALLHFQHLVTALTYLHAAREFVADRELERFASVDITKFSTGLERRLLAARQNLGCPAVEGTAGPRREAERARRA